MLPLLTQRAQLHLKGSFVDALGNDEFQEVIEVASQSSQENLSMMKMRRILYVV